MSFIQISKPRPEITLLTMNRPERMNAMAFDVMIPLRDALREISFDNETRVVVLTGAGAGFSSGADHQDDGIVPHIAGLTLPTIARRALRILDEVVLSLRDMHQPVIGAINGPAIGGGLCLATACDIRIASNQAYFRAAGINNGLTSAELGLSYLLPRAIGSSRAFDIMLSGRDVSAEEAERIGLVSQVVEPNDLLDTAYERAEQIIGYSRIGVELTKQLLWASLDAGGLHSHMNHEGNAQLYVRLLTDNFEESVLARREGRKPVFLDQRDWGHPLDSK